MLNKGTILLTTIFVLVLNVTVIHYERRVASLENSNNVQVSTKPVLCTNNSTVNKTHNSPKYEDEETQLFPPFKDVAPGWKPVLSTSSLKRNASVNAMWWYGKMETKYFVTPTRNDSLCWGHLQNVCFNAKGMIFVGNSSDLAWYGIPGLQIGGTTYTTVDKVQNYTWYTNSTFIFAKNMEGQHIGHLAYRTVSANLVIAELKKIGVNLQNILFLREDVPFLDWFNNVATLAGLFSFPGRIILKQEFSKGNGVCLKDAYLNCDIVKYFTTYEQSDSIRKIFYSGYQIKLQKCPPKRILVVRRENEPRDYMNINTVRRVVEQYGYPVDYFHPNKLMSAREQAVVFANYGLIISPHGSQLSNLLFAQPNSAVIELTPFNWGLDFYWMGVVNRLHYQVIEQGYATGIPYNEFMEVHQNKTNGLPVDPKTLNSIKFSKYVIDPIALEASINSTLLYLKSLNCSW